jgi:hypothetical protein
MENLIYLLTLVLNQAKEQVYALPVGRRKKRNRRRARAERKRSCAKAFFDRSVDVLIDIVRKDRETAYLDLENHTVMAKTLLKWLYYGNYFPAGPDLGKLNACAQMLIQTIIRGCGNESALSENVIRDQYLRALWDKGTRLSR